MHKLILTDCDGVLTPNIKLFDHDGKSPMKGFCDLDRSAIKLFKARGDTVCMLSGDPNNKHFATNLLEIDFWYSKINNKLDKLAALDGLIHHYKVNIENIVFCGDDPAFDLKIANYIQENGGKVFVPKDSGGGMSFFHKLSVDGGKGVLLEIYEKLHHRNYDLGEFNY